VNGVAPDRVAAECDVERGSRSQRSRWRAPHPPRRRNGSPGRDRRSRAIGPRLALEAGLTVTNVVFAGAEVRDLGPDPDGVLLNWVFALRAGVVYRLR